MRDAEKVFAAISGVGASAFVGFVLMARGLAWVPALVALGGLWLIGSTVIVTIYLVERNDAKHALANLARIARVEAEEAGRRQRQDLVG